MLELLNFQKGFEKGNKVILRVKSKELIYDMYEGVIIRNPFYARM